MQCHMFSFAEGSPQYYTAKYQVSNIQYIYCHPAKYKVSSTHNVCWGDVDWAESGRRLQSADWAWHHTGQSPGTGHHNTWAPASVLHVCLFCFIKAFLHIISNLNVCKRENYDDQLLGKAALLILDIRPHPGPWPCAGRMGAAVTAHSGN